MENGNIGGGMTWKVWATAALAGVLMIGGCNSNPKYAEAKAAVMDSLTQNNLSNISVAEDRDTGVITLTGTVATEAQRDQAVSVTRRTATTYTVDDKIVVVPPTDTSIAPPAGVVPPAATSSVPTAAAGTARTPAKAVKAPASAATHPTTAP